MERVGVGSRRLQVDVSPVPLFRPYPVEALVERSRKVLVYLHASADDLDLLARYLQV